MSYTLFRNKDGFNLDWSPLIILSRMQTGSWCTCTIQGISLDTLCPRSDVTLQGLHNSYQPRSKLNLHETKRLVSGIFHEPRSETPDLRARFNPSMSRWYCFYGNVTCCWRLSWLEGSRIALGSGNTNSSTSFLFLVYSGDVATVFVCLLPVNPSSLISTSCFQSCSVFT